MTNIRTKEEIEQEYQNNVENLFIEYGDKIREAAKIRDAALAELDDPMARLIAAGRRAVDRHAAHKACRCIQCLELRDAIEFAEQRKVQE